MDMASETEVGAAPVEKTPSLPRIAAAPAMADAPPANAAEAERNPIFDALVGPNEDVAGLVAYSLYKQNKRSWLEDFIKVVGRAPTEAESRAYIIGESTERRLNTYRHLAAATLAGQRPQAPAAAASAKGSALTGLLWALVVILALAVLGLALHAGYLTPAK
jgi:hypothetical protein